MSVAEQVERDLVAAMRARDETRLSALRLLKAAAKNAEVEKRSHLTGDEYETVVRRQVKMRREAAEGYERGGRPEQAARERAELEILAAYLPAGLDEEALRRLVAEAIEQTGASSPAELGKVMSHAMRAAQGRADGSRVQGLARAMLAERAG